MLLKFITKNVNFLLFCFLEEGRKNSENSGKFTFIGSHTADGPSRERVLLQGESRRLLLCILLGLFVTPQQQISISAVIISQLMCTGMARPTNLTFSLLTGGVSCGLRSNI